MKIRLPSLKEGENPLNESLDAKALGLDEEIFRSPVLVTGVAVYDGYMVDVRMQVTTSGIYVCDRCAGDFTRDFDIESRVVILTRDAEDTDEEEAEGLITIGARGTEADLSQEIVDAILLDLPMQNLCRPDCKGFCPYCFKDLNAGPCEHSSELDGKESQD